MRYWGWSEGHWPGFGNLLWIKDSWGVRDNSLLLYTDSHWLESYSAPHSQTFMSAYCVSCVILNNIGTTKVNKAQSLLLKRGLRGEPRLAHTILLGKKIRDDWMFSLISCMNEVISCNNEVWMREKGSSFINFLDYLTILFGFVSFIQ